MIHGAPFWIQKLHLMPHPEGGYYRETYRSAEVIPSVSLPERYESDRNISTGIYFLLDKKDFSAFHRLKSDEIWHFYTGSPLELYIIEPDGNLELQLIGNDPEKSEVFQFAIQAGSWFGARVKSKESFSLIGCTVAPGFDFLDFELADRAYLLQNYPQHQQLILELTKEN